MGDWAAHPVQALCGVRSSLCGPFVRWQGPWRGVGEVLSRAQNGPARAVGTPPHPRTSLSGFHARAKALSNGGQQGTPGGKQGGQSNADLCTYAMQERYGNISVHEQKKGGGSMRDWRLQATAKLAKDAILPSGHLARAGTDITVASMSVLKKSNVLLTIHVPNATALFFNIAHRTFTEARGLFESHELGRHAKKRREFFMPEADAMTYMELMLQSVVAAHTGIEAYANEAVPEGYVYTYWSQRAKKEESLNREEIERQLTLCQKLADVLPKAHSVPAPKKGQPAWQRYKELKEIRDRIIHMKSVDRKSTGAEVESVWDALFRLDSPLALARPIVEYFAGRIEPKPGWLGQLPD